MMLMMLVMAMVICLLLVVDFNNLNSPRGDREALLNCAGARAANIYIKGARWRSGAAL